MYIVYFLKVKIAGSSHEGINTFPPEAWSIRGIMNAIHGKISLLIGFSFYLFLKRSETTSTNLFSNGKKNFILIRQGI